MPRKRTIGIACMILAACGLAFVGWNFLRTPALIRGLRSLPEVAQVEYSGAASPNPLMVVHLRDWHFVPGDLARLEGIDHGEHLRDVEVCQVDQLAILRHLIKAQGVREVFIEGLTEASAPDFRLRVELLRTLAKAEAAGVLDAEGKAPARS